MKVFVVYFFQILVEEINLYCLNMTILSKKKSLQGKQEVEATEATAHHGGNISIPLGSIPNHTQVKLLFLFSTVLVIECKRK